MKKKLGMKREGCIDWMKYRDDEGGIKEDMIEKIKEILEIGEDKDEDIGVMMVEGDIGVGIKRSIEVNERIWMEENRSLSKKESKDEMDDRKIGNEKILENKES